MNIFDALNAHLAWKRRLRDYVDGELGEYLEPDQVECEDACELGKWIVANHEAMKALPAYHRVREQHADLHRCAAVVVRAANRGEMATAEAALQGECARLSALLVKAITTLNKALAAPLEQPPAA